MPEPLAGKLYEPEVVDGFYRCATHCKRCDKPFAPWGVPVATEHAEAYCWQDHEERDCKALCAEAADEIARLRSFRPTPAPRVDALIARLREAAK